MALELTRDHVERIRAHGVETYPHECCGFLIGSLEKDVREVALVVPARNEHTESPRNRYVVSPEAYLAAEREADRKGLDVVGFYHSHPDAEARPSEFDRNHALPGCSYAIVSVREGTALELRSWILAEDRSAFHEEALTCLEAPRGRTA